MGDIRAVDLNLLAVFDALYETRSVTRAAGRLSLTQPTVSGMLGRLRHAFSDPLFVRTAGGMRLTPGGWKGQSSGVADSSVRDSRGSTRFR